jgi:GntR family transcriptional regulator
MLFQMNFQSGVPPYLQIVDQIKSAAASGALRPGESLPSIRPLAEQLRLNRNTVAKAYGELEHQGIIETIAGKGCFLSNARSRLRADAKRELLAQNIDAAVIQAHHLQVAREQFLAMVEQRLDSFERRQRAAAAGKSARRTS